MSDISTSFKSISHPIRIQILLLLAEKINNGANFTNLSKDLQIESSGKLAFHLEKLKGDLIAQSEDGRYYLTDHGKKAVQAIKILGLKSTDEAESENVQSLQHSIADKSDKIGNTPIVAAVTAIVLTLILPIIIGMALDAHIGLVSSLLGALIAGIAIQQYVSNKGTSVSQLNFSAVVFIGVMGGIEIIYGTIGIGIIIERWRFLLAEYMISLAIAVIYTVFVTSNDRSNSVKKVIWGYSIFFLTTYTKWGNGGLTFVFLQVVSLFIPLLMIFAAYIVSFFSKEQIVKFKPTTKPWILTYIILLYPFFKYIIEGAKVFPVSSGIGMVGIQIFIAACITISLIRETGIYAKITTKKGFTGLAAIYFIIRVSGATYLYLFTGLQPIPLPFAYYALAIVGAVEEIFAMYLAYKTMQSIFEPAE